MPIASTAVFAKTRLGIVGVGVASAFQHRECSVARSSYCGVYRSDERPATYDVAPRFRSPRNIRGLLSMS